jgi:hypothetical protein
MPKKSNSLASLKTASENKLEVAAAKEPNPKASTSKPGSVGRPQKPVSEKETYSLLLKITPRERNLLQEKAGLVPLATLVKAHLREPGGLLDNND